MQGASSRMARRAAMAALAGRASLLAAQQPQRGLVMAMRYDTRRAGLLGWPQRVKLWWEGSCSRAISISVVCKSGDNKVPARLAKKQQMLNDMEEQAAEAAGSGEAVPKVTLDHVTLSFARSGGAGGQNVNKVNTKVDMRFNVMAAHWLPLRVRLKLLQTEKNRINSDGELIISSTKTRTQKGNVEDALAKLQEIIDAAGYVPPPPSEETKQRIAKLAATEDLKRLQLKKQIANKKSRRRDKSSWD